MNQCMHASMYACMQVCMNANTYVQMLERMYCMHARMYAQTDFSRVSVRMYVCIHVMNLCVYST